MQPAEHELVFIGLGSNVGTTELKLQVLRQAAANISALEGTRIVARSTVYRNPPWGFEQQDEFLNAVIGIESSFEPLPLLRELKTIETNLGRQPTFRWGPRLIDIDILLYGNRTVQLPELTIPHPHLTERDFALVPLLEIFPDAALPDETPLRSFCSTDSKPDLVQVGAL